MWRPAEPGAAAGAPGPGGNRRAAPPEVTAAPAHGRRSTTDIIPEPAQLIRDFDSKMRSIQDMLSQYQSSKATRGGIGQESEVRERGNSGGSGGISGGTGAAGAGGTSRRRLALQPRPISGGRGQLREGQDASRRVKSAVPGVTRALAERIEFYRNHLDLAQSKADRAREAQLADREAQASDSAPPVNFIDLNVRSVGDQALPYSLQLMIDSLRDQGISNMRMRAGNGTCGVRPSSGRASSRGLSPTRPDSAFPAVRRASTSNTSTGASPCAGGRSQGTQPRAGCNGAGAAATVRFAWDCGVGNGLAVGSPTPPTMSPRFSSRASTREGAEGGASPSFFLTGVDMPDAGHKSDRGQTEVQRSSTMRPEPHPAIGSDQQANYSHSPFGRDTISSGPNVISGNPAGSSGGGGAPGALRGDTAAVTDAEFQTNRRLRLTLAARPASGGSPTRRLDFIAEHAALRAERAVHASEVRERAAEIEWARQRGVREAHALREQRRREEEARMADERAQEDLQERQRQWTCIVGLGAKLSFIAEQIEEDRRVRSLRALRKEAAVKIATWYKRVLLRRRQRELVELLQRLRRLLKPYIAVQKNVIRQHCAARIVSFLQYAESSNMAVVGVRKLKSGVEALQRSWRNAILIRNLHRRALYNQLTRTEREIVVHNKRAEKNLQNHLMRLGKSVNILEPSESGRSRAATPVQGPPSRATSMHDNSSVPTTPAGLDTQTSMARSTAAPSLHLERSGVVGSSRRFRVGATANYDRARQPGRGALLQAAHDPADDEDEVLRDHLEMVPREIREQVAETYLMDSRRAHRRLLEKYSQDKQLYLARKPIEEMRQKMLRDAGLHVEPEVRPPIMPRMTLIHPRAKLRELLRAAIALNGERLRRLSEEAARQRREEEAAAGGGERGGGVAWADQAGGAGGPRGAGSRKSLLGRSSLRRASSGFGKGGLGRG